MIELINVSKWYPTEFGRHYVFRDVSLVLPPDKSVAIIGPNGAGKSTLLRLIGGADVPSEGRIIKTGRISPPMGLTPGLQSSLTGSENARFAGRIYGMTREEITDLIEYVREVANIGKFFDLPVNTYSAGMRQRVSFAINMAMQFDYYLFDEISAGGDREFQKVAKAMVEERLNTAKFLMASHRTDDLIDICKAGIVIQNGEFTYYEDIRDALAAYGEDEDGERKSKKNKKRTQRVVRTEGEGGEDGSETKMSRKARRAAERQKRKEAQAAGGEILPEGVAGLIGATPEDGSAAAPEAQADGTPADSADAAPARTKRKIRVRRRAKAAGDAEAAPSGAAEQAEAASAEESLSSGTQEQPGDGAATQAADTAAAVDSIDDEARRQRRLLRREQRQEEASTSAKAEDTETAEGAAGEPAPGETDEGDDREERKKRRLRRLKKRNAGASTEADGAEGQSGGEIDEPAPEQDVPGSRERRWG